MNHLYRVYMNGSYINQFEDYTKAYECREMLERKFPKAIIEIEPYYI